MADKHDQPKTQKRFLVFQDVFKTSWKSLQRNTFRLPRHLEDVFKTSSRRLQDVFKTCLQLCLQDVLEDKKNVTMKTSSVRLHQDECLLGSVIQMKNKLRKWKDFCSRIGSSSWKTQFFFYVLANHVQQIFERLTSHFEFLLRDLID